MYEILRKAIKKILLEDHHANRSSFQGHNNNSLNATSDSGNVDYEYKINEFYSISESDTSNNLQDSFELEIKVRDDYKKKFKDRGISTDRIYYKANDLNIFNLEKRNIITKLHTILGNKGVI